ncbi:MAG: hypothetical protein AAFV29_16540 [Myxococcota bacterium]
MTHDAHRKGPIRRRTAGVALLGWLAGAYLLPFLHVVAHDFPHQHVGHAVVYLFDALEHHHDHHDHHHSDRDAHAHAANDDPRPSADGAEHSSTGDRPAPIQNPNVLAHGFVGLLAPITVQVPVITQWILELPSLRPSPPIVLIDAPIQRARDPPSA